MAGTVQSQCTVNKVKPKIAVGEYVALSKAKKKTYVNHIVLWTCWWSLTKSAIISATHYGWKAEVSESKTGVSRSGFLVYECTTSCSILRQQNSKCLVFLRKYWAEGISGAHTSLRVSGSFVLHLKKQNRTNMFKYVTLWMDLEEFSYILFTLYTEHI